MVAALSPSPPRALVVDDDPIVREIVLATLRRHGIDAVPAGSIAAALAVDAEGPADLMIVDVNLPDGLGFDLVDALRRRHDTPVIFLSSRGAVSDRLRGFASGADDYLVKPFDPAELAARARAVLRRSAALPQPDRLIARDGWTLDLMRRELAAASGALVSLTRGEFDLLSALVQASPTALDRDYLLEVVSSADATTGPRTIDVMISRIRTKLDAAGLPALRIVTVRGNGYRAESRG